MKWQKKHMAYGFSEGMKTNDYYPGIVLLLLVVLAAGVIILFCIFLLFRGVDAMKFAAVLWQVPVLIAVSALFGLNFNCCVSQKLDTIPFTETSTTINIEQFKPSLVGCGYNDDVYFYAYGTHLYYAYYADDKLQVKSEKVGYHCVTCDEQQGVTPHLVKTAFSREFVINGEKLKEEEISTYRFYIPKSPPGYDKQYVDRN